MHDMRHEINAIAPAAPSFPLEQYFDDKYRFILRRRLMLALHYFDLSLWTCRHFDKLSKCCGRCVVVVQNCILSVVFTLVLRMFISCCLSADY